MSWSRSLLPIIRELHAEIRSHVLEACSSQAIEQAARVVADDAGDTIFAIDRVAEEVLIERLERIAGALGGIVLVAEGLPGGELGLPRGIAPAAAQLRVIVDPIDGTRCIMYQKRSAWVLTGVAPNRGSRTTSADVELAVQTEIPTLKQHLSDELWAVRGSGAYGERFNRLTGERTPLELRPSRATGIEQGYAMLTRFFPGARDEIAAIDEQIVRATLGAQPSGKALCFEDQYASTGGQLYELMSGHDRFNADLRPLMSSVLAQRGLPASLCCHPYDLCTALIAEELGIVLTDPAGGRLVFPLDVEADVAWVGYANQAIRRQVEPALLQALGQRGLLPRAR